MKRGKARVRTRPVTWLGLTMLAVIYAAVAFLVIDNRLGAEATARREGENLVRIIDQAYTNIFHSVDASLLVFRKAYQESPATFAIDAWAKESLIDNGLILNFTITDAQGRTVAATRVRDSSPANSIIGANFSDRDYFQNQKHAQNDELQFSEPLKLRLTGEAAVVLTRRIASASGAFAGIVAALIDPAALGKTAAGISLGAQGSFGLVGLDGIIRTRVVGGVIDINASGHKIGQAEGVLRHVNRSRTGTYWNEPGRIDNISRLISYRQLDPFPMIAMVTVSRAEVFRHANEHAVTYGTAALLLTFAILLAMRWGGERERKVAEAIDELKRAEAASKESLANLARAEAMAHLGHIKYEKASGLYTWSDGVYRIMGKFPDTFTPTMDTSLELIDPEDRLSLELYRNNVLSGLAETPITLRTVDIGGQTKYLEVWSAPLHDSSGEVAGMFGTVQDVTEKKLAEAALMESHANLARAESMILLGHYKYDAATERSIWSSGAYRVFGKSPGSFTPTKEAVAALFHPDDRAELRRHQDEVLKGNALPRLTSRIVKDDGEITVVESWSTPTRDEKGATIGYFGTVQDVTERFRADAVALESRENLARAEAMALLGHTRTGHDGTYTWSAGVYRIMQRSPETYTPTPESALQLIHPEDRAAHEQYRRDVMAGLDVARKTVRIVLDSGETKHVEFWSAPIRDKDGVVTGKFSTLQDVTALKRTEALIGESYANLERAERMALLGHYKIDRGTGNLVWSSGIFRIFGLSPESFTPTLRGAMELVHPEDRHFLKKIRDGAMSGQEIPHVTLRAIHSGGAAIDIEYWATPVRDSDGRITGVFGTVQDITVRKRAEEALARANQELEARVGERTAELAMEMRRREEAQMTLGQMQKMEAVGQLTAGIAHDFNNLLAVIGGSLEFVDAAAARGLTAEPELIDAALRATRRGRELVRRLLAFSRQSPLRAEATNIDQLVLDTLRLLQRTLGQGIDMVTQLDARAAVISVDRNQMANALLNLALNARDAMPDGGQLTIATTCRPAASGASSRFPMGEEVCIVISDTGVGMTDEVRSRAFEPFFTTKPDGLGSGLGLSMVQGFVEQSGGKIDIDSAQGSGTTITIVLPRVASESRADEADPAGGVSANGREKTVLLVEDDPDVRVVTAAQLRQLGYRVHAVGNGMEAIDLISSPANIDITLTDIVLPGGLDGVELIKEAMRARPKMGVLCMSGYDPTQKHRKWLKMQNINFLEKPFSSSRLAQALDAALAH